LISGTVVFGRPFLFCIEIKNSITSPFPVCFLAAPTGSQGAEVRAGAAQINGALASFQGEYSHLPVHLP